MASRELLKSLDFRRFNLRLDGISKIVVRYGASKEKGHVAARKFFKNYLPVLLYHNPSIVASVKKYGSGVAGEGGEGGGGKKEKSNEGVLSTESSSKSSKKLSSSSASSETNMSPLSIAALCELSEEPHVAFFGENGSGRVFKTREIAEEFKKQEENGGQRTESGASSSSSSSSSSGVGSIQAGGGGIKGLALHVDRYIFREITGGNEFVAEERPRKPQGKKGGRRKTKNDGAAAAAGVGGQPTEESSSTEKLA